MKKLGMTLLASVVGLLLAFSAMAAGEAYPYSNPTYIPNAVATTASYSAPGNYAMTTNGLSVVSLRITGTCTSLAGTLQGTNDGTNWSNLTLHPVTASATATTPVVSVAAVGFWRASSSGFTQVRLNISALTAACAVTMAGSPHAGLME